MILSRVSWDYKPTYNLLQWPFQRWLNWRYQDLRPPWFLCYVSAKGISPQNSKWMIMDSMKTQSYTPWIYIYIILMKVIWYSSPLGRFQWNRNIFPIISFQQWNIVFFLNLTWVLLDDPPNHGPWLSSIHGPLEGIAQNRITWGSLEHLGNVGKWTTNSWTGAWKEIWSRCWLSKSKVIASEFFSIWEVEMS